MTAAQVNMTMDQGADFVAHIYWQDQNSVPFPIEPPIRMEIRTAGMNQLVTALQVGAVQDDDAYDIVYNTDNGMIQIYISAERTNELSAGTYVYDMFCNYSDRAVSKTRTQRLIEGTIEVRGRVTRNV